MESFKKFSVHFTAYALATVLILGALGLSHRVRCDCSITLNLNNASAMDSAEGLVEAGILPAQVAIMPTKKKG